MRDRWRTAFQEHEQALERYLTTIAGLDEARWNRDREPGKWSPARITQHLILYYEASARVLRGELEMRYRVGPVWRTLLRWLLLPHILFHRSLPLRSIAPREIRPGDEPPLPRQASIERLKEVAAIADAEMRRVAGEGRRRFGHPYFGRMSPLRFLRFSAVHLDHHRRQVEATPATPSAEALR